MLNQSFLNTLNVLYVEDSKTVRMQFSNILNKLFNNVITAVDGQDGYEQYLSHKKEGLEINIIISDINMPNMNGIEFLEKIRETDLDTPFIFTTSFSESDYLIKAIKFNATDYVIKPVNTKDLIYIVQKVCQSKYHEKLKKQTVQDLEELTKAINEVSLVTKTDLKGRITFANKSFCKISGYMEKSLIGQTHKIIKHPKMSEDVIENLWRDVQGGKIWEGKSRNISKGGDEFYMFSTIIPLYDESDTDIIEFMWISFLTTQDEMEQNEFKRKVIENAKETRRVNTQARERIDQLQGKLLKYKHFDILENTLQMEKKRSAKFFSQTRYYKKEVTKQEEKLEQMNNEANTKIKKALYIAQDMKEKKDEALVNLDNLTNELELRETDVKTLNEEVLNQMQIIEELKESIELKEEQLGMED